MASRFEETEKGQLRRLASEELHRLNEVPSLERAVEAARSVLSSFDAVAEQSPHRSQWACSAGCSFCCHMPVHMTALEAIDVADHVLTQFGEQERQRAAERVASTAERIARMSETEFKDSRTPCALLDDRGRCTVYEVRPLACRGFHSTSVDVCRASFESNDTACDEARDRDTEDLCARLVVAMHAISRAGELGSLRFELHSALTRLLGPGRTGSTQEVVQALEGVRSRPSPLDVPLEAVIARLRDA